MVIRILPEWFILRLWNLLTPSLVVFQLIFIRRFLESAQAYELGNVYLWIVSSRSDVIDFAHGSVTSILFRGMNFDLSLPPVVILPLDRGDLLISIFDLRILLLLKMRATSLQALWLTFVQSLRVNSNRSVNHDILLLQFFYFLPKLSDNLRFNEIKLLKFSRLRMITQSFSPLVLLFSQE